MFFRKALHLDLDSFGENGSAALTARLTNDIAHVSGGRHRAVGSTDSRTVEDDCLLVGRDVRTVRGCCCWC